MFVNVDTRFDIAERSEHLWQAPVLLKVIAHHGLFNRLAVAEKCRSEGVERGMEAQMRQIPEVSQTLVFELKRTEITWCDFVWWIQFYAP